MLNAALPRGVLCLALAAVVAPAASVTLVNHGFEQGFTGWTILGSVTTPTSTSVITHDNLVWDVSPFQTQMAALNSNGLTAAGFDAFFLIPPGTLQSLNSTGSLTNGAGIYQDFTANAGDTVTMYFNYVARDYIPYNDPAFAVLSSPSSFQAQTIASIYSGGWEVGTSGSSGWRELTFVVPETGTHRLGFAVTNSSDTVLDAALFLDNQPGGAVTTPGATPVFPILPDSNPCFGCFAFTNPQPGLWYDPPFAEAYTYTLTGALFNQFATPPDSFGFGDLLFTDLSGTNASFVASPGVKYDIDPTSKFMISGLKKGAIDFQSPDFAIAFPAWLNWTGNATELQINVTPYPAGTVPEPSTYGLIAFGLGGLLLHRRFTRQ